MGKNKGLKENEGECLKPIESSIPTTNMKLAQIDSSARNGVDRQISENGVGHEISDDKDLQVSSCNNTTDNDVLERTKCVDNCCCTDEREVKGQYTQPDCNCEVSCNECIIPVAGDDPVSFIVYESELQMPDIMRLIQKDLSEPYSIYTYRYFIHNWPHLCFMARVRDQYVGAIVCKLDYHKKLSKRGYIAMLAVDSSYRKLKIGSTLVKKAIQAMVEEDADEVVLETEITNKPALRLYENLGFVRDKRLFRYYLNGVDALRLKLWLR